MKWPWQQSRKSKRRTPSKRHPHFEQKVLVNEEQAVHLEYLFRFQPSLRSVKKRWRRGEFDHLDHPLFDFSWEDLEQAYEVGWAIDIFDGRDPMNN